MFSAVCSPSHISFADLVVLPDFLVVNQYGLVGGVGSLVLYFPSLNRCDAGDLFLIECGVAQYARRKLLPPGQFFLLRGFDEFFEASYEVLRGTVSPGGIWYFLLVLKYHVCCILPKPFALYGGSLSLVICVGIPNCDRTLSRAGMQASVGVDRNISTAGYLEYRNWTTKRCSPVGRGPSRSVAITL